MSRDRGLGAPQYGVPSLPDTEIPRTAKTGPSFRSFQHLTGVSTNSQVESRNGRTVNGRTVNGRSVRNTILLRLPPNEFEVIQPYLKFTPFTFATCLQREHESIDAVYFMNSGIASMLVETDDGRSVEVGISGREDMIGLPLAAGLDNFPHNVIVQVPGDGFQVDSETMKRVMGSLPELRHPHPPARDPVAAVCPECGLQPAAQCTPAPGPVAAGGP